MRHIDQLLGDVLDLDREYRADYFRMRNASERAAIMELWAQSERLSATDIVALPQPYQSELIDQVCGNPRRGLASSGRVFTVEPCDDPVELDQGSRNNKRRFIVLDRALPMPAEKAIYALLRFGPWASVEVNRGKVREVLPPASPTKKKRSRASAR